MRSPKVKFLTIFTFCIFITKMSFASNSCSNEAGTMFRIEPNLIKAIALVESNLKKDSIGKNRDKNNNIKEFRLLVNADKPDAYSPVKKTWNNKR